MSYPPPAAPVNLKNKCAGHAVTVCLTWADPTGLLVSYSVFYRPTGSSISFLEIDTDVPWLVINNLRAATSFDFFVVGFNGLGVESFVSSVLTVVTGASTPKQNPAIDISNVQCAPLVNVNTSRVNIKCTWTAPTKAPVAIEVKCRCVSSVRETVRIRKDITGPAAATATSITFQINRDVANCNIYIKALYGSLTNKHQPGTRQHVQLVVGV